MGDKATTRWRKREACGHPSPHGHRHRETQPHVRLGRISEGEAQPHRRGGRRQKTTGSGKALASEEESGTIGAGRRPKQKRRESTKGRHKKRETANASLRARHGRRGVDGIEEATHVAIAEAELAEHVGGIFSLIMKKSHICLATFAGLSAKASAAKARQCDRSTSQRQHRAAVQPGRQVGEPPKLTDDLRHPKPDLAYPAARAGGAGRPSVSSPDAPLSNPDLGLKCWLRRSPSATNTTAATASGAATGDTEAARGHFEFLFLCKPRSSSHMLTRGPSKRAGTSFVVQQPVASRASDFVWMEHDTNERTTLSRDADANNNHARTLPSTNR